MRRPRGWRMARRMGKLVGLGGGGPGGAPSISTSEGAEHRPSVAWVDGTNQPSSARGGSVWQRCRRGRAGTHRRRRRARGRLRKFVSLCPSLAGSLLNHTPAAQVGHTWAQWALLAARRTPCSLLTTSSPGALQQKPGVPLRTSGTKHPFPHLCAGC